MKDTLKNRSDVSVVLLFFIALTIFGVLGAAFIVKDYARARASTAWPVYDAIVLSPRENGHSLRYVYSVDGQTHEASRRRFVTAFLSSPENEIAGPGETVTVYVDPKDHDIAVLHPGGSGGFFAIVSLFFGASVFFGVGGIVRTLTLAAVENSDAQSAAI